MHAASFSIISIPPVQNAATHPLVVIAGPTGSGKSALALQLAGEFCGEVVNCDSVQIYRHFDIGSAKLPESERRGIPHHLIDIAAPDELFTAGDYSRLARAALLEITARGNLPIVVGGTGFYLRALLEGLFEGPPRDQPLRDRLAGREKKRPGSLHKLLARLDPDSAARIHANDHNKLIRALEVILATRRPLTEMFARGRDPLAGYNVMKFGLNPPRDQLYRRIERRSQAMYDQGLVEETRAILAMGYTLQCKPFESLGYAEALRVIQGEMTPEQAVAATAMATRRYAKRQWTWFRREKDMLWIDSFGDDAAATAAPLILSWLRSG